MQRVVRSFICHQSSFLLKPRANMTAVAAGRGNGIGDLVDPKAPSVEVVETIQDSTKNTDPAGRHVSEDDWVYPYPTDFKLSEHPIDDIRKLKVDLTKFSCQ
jgi:hypothetical protein